MSKMIQIRNVPDELHRTLKTRAAQLGMSLSDYLLSEIHQIADKPTLDEYLARVRRRESVRVKESSAEVIRLHREA
jgi:predicted nucleic acid-binding protein